MFCNQGLFASVITFKMVKIELHEVKLYTEIIYYWCYVKHSFLSILNLLIKVSANQTLTPRNWLSAGEEQPAVVMIKLSWLIAKKRQKKFKRKLIHIWTLAHIVSGSRDISVYRLNLTMINMYFFLMIKYSRSVVAKPCFDFNLPNLLYRTLKRLSISFISFTDN